MSFHVPEPCRKQLPPNHPLYTTAADGNNGAFDLGRGIRCVASDGMGWEHVSVSYPDKTPSWNTMCIVKAIFWDPEDCVVQYHPPQSQYVNNHPFCLHLWRPTAQVIPTPPSFLVGIK